MDPALRALCVEVLNGNVNSEGFAWLLMETGVVTEEPEWKVATRLLGENDAINLMAKKFGDTVQ